MPLIVYTFASYPSSYLAMSNGDPLWESKHCLLALKGIKRAFRLPGGPRVPREEAPRAAIEWFALQVARVWEKVVQPRGRYVLVPLPDSQAVKAVAECRTATLARAIAEKVGPEATVADILRWSEPMKSAAKEDGPRDPRELYPKLVLLAGRRPSDGRYILIDDVMTTGGHIQAAAAKLNAADLRCSLAFCAGDTTDRRRDPFGFFRRELQEYDPTIDMVRVFS